jgi:hypothetical protein
MATDFLKPNSNDNSSNNNNNNTNRNLFDFANRFPLTIRRPKSSAVSTNLRQTLKQHSAATTTTNTATTSGSNSNKNLSKPNPVINIRIKSAIPKDLESNHRIDHKNEIDQRSTSETLKALKALAGSAQSRLIKKSNTSQEFFDYTPKLTLGNQSRTSNYSSISANNNKNNLNSYKNKKNSTEALDLNNLETIELIKINKTLRNRVYSSYLIYSAAGTNPFSSNFDFIKKNNPEFYESLAKANGGGELNGIFRFNRANSSLSLVNNDHKKIEKLLIESDREEDDNKDMLKPRPGSHRSETNINNHKEFLEIENEENVNAENLPQIKQEISRTEKNVHRLSATSHDSVTNANLPINKSHWNVIKRNINIKSTTPNGKVSSTLTQNQFLNYRNETKKKKNTPITCKLRTFFSKKSYSTNLN